MTLAHINSFDTDNPTKLSRQLSDLEDNISEEFATTREACVPALVLTNFTPTVARGIISIQPDQQLSIDTGIASAAVVFPPNSPANFGRRFVIVKRVAANAINTSCQTPGVLCNGAAFPALAAVGRYEFTCDASGYYR